MSLLSITKDMVTPRGRNLPDGIYRATIEETAVRGQGQGTVLWRRYGNLRTRDGQTEFTAPDGKPFRIGNRKLFNNSWTSHPNVQAQEIGHGEIGQEAVAVGLAPAPQDSQPVTLDFPSWEQYAQALAGRDVLVRVVNKPRKRDGVEVKDETGQTVIDPTIVGYSAL